MIHGRPYRSAILAFFVGLASIAFDAANGQNASDAVDRAQLLRTPPSLRDDPTVDATGTDDSHAVASPNDPDLGEQAILKRDEHYRAFTFSVAAPISYTSNVALTRSGEESDVLFTPGFSLSYAPHLTSTLYANVSVGQQFFFYDDFTELDFSSFDVRVGLTYVMPKFYNVVLRADYDYNRLSKTDSFDDFFSNHGVTFGAEIPFRIGRAQQISVGTDLNFSIAADPDPPGRHDLSAFVGYSANLTRNLTLGVVARLAVRDYTEGDRTDVSGILAVSANYRFTKWVSANAISTFATNDSNQDVFDYDVANVGAALALALKF